MTIAVEDKASAPPSTRAATVPSPSAAAMPAISAGRDEHLRGAEAEEHAAHAHEALEGELEADHEQQEDDAELGDRADVPRVGDRHDS